MDFSILLLCALMSSTFVNADTEFSTDPVESLNATAPITSAHGSSDIHCTVQCAAMGTAACAATAYLSETQVCLFSAVSNADFSAAAPHSAAYRRVKAQEQFTTPVPSPKEETTAANSEITEYVMLSRTNLSLSFARNWSEYEDGFGDGTDVWLGLRKINELTESQPLVLRVETYTMTSVYILEYSGFSVGDASTNYTMTFDSYLSNCSNASSDSFVYHKGMPFSTMDRVNDLSSFSCSQRYFGAGWWFNRCGAVIPTGGLYSSGSTVYAAMYWMYADDWNYLKAIRMLLLVK